MRSVNCNIWQFLAAVLILLSARAAGSSNEDSPSSAPEVLFLKNVCTSAFLGRQAELDELSLLLDARSVHDPSHPTVGFRDNLHYLRSSLAPDRPAFWKDLKMTSKSRPDNYLRLRIKASIQNDDYLAARKLLRENRYNHFTLFLNHTVSAVSGLAHGQTQPLFQLPVDLIFIWNRLGRSTPRERKSLVLMRRFLDLHPADPDADGLDRRIGALDSRRVKYLFAREYDFGHKCLGAGQLERALYHFRNACDLDPSSSGSRKHISKTQSLLAARDRHSRPAATVLAGEDLFETAEEEILYARVLKDLCLEDPGALRRDAGDFIKRFPQSNYSDDIWYAATTILDFHADRLDVLGQLESICSFYPDSNAAILSGQIIANPVFNLQKYYRMEKARYSSALRRYILTGARETDQQLYIATSTTAASPVNAPENLGVFFVLDIAIRGVRTIFSNPVDAEGVIHAAGLYSRTFPNSPASLVMQRKLVSLYKAQGNYTQALVLARQTRSYSSSYLAGLENKSARKLYHLISTNEDEDLRRLRLARLIDEYPNAPIVKKARKDVTDLIEHDIYEFRLPPRRIAACPELWQARGLFIDPDLYDGLDENGELMPDGVLSLKDGPVLYRLKGNPFPVELDLDVDQRKAIRSLADGLFGRAAFPGPDDKRTERIFPVELSGSIGSRGAEAHPAFLPIEAAPGEMKLYE